MFDMENGCMPYDYHHPKTLKTKPAKYVITPELHEKIRKLYQNKTNSSGEVRAFAEKHKLPRWKITRHAIHQGWIAKQKKEPVWSDKELSILSRQAHHCPERIQIHLQKAGFRRSLTGIVLKRKRMRFLANIEGNSASSLALCLGEDIHFVMNQIKRGHLKAKRRDQNRTEKQGGPAWLIRDRDVREFIMNYPALIDLRKVDKFWFISILTDSDLS